MPKFTHPFIWCLLSAALFGLSPAACKALLAQNASPIVLASLLYLGAGVATAPWSLRVTEKPTAIEWIRVGLAIGFGGILGPIFLMIGLHWSSAGDASLLLNLESVATVFLGWLLFKEHLSLHLVSASLLTLLGGICLTTSPQWVMDSGSLWIIAACVCWGVDNHVTAVIERLSPTQVTCIKGLVSGGFNAGLALYLGAIWGDIWFILIGLVIGALCYGLSMVLYVSGAQQIGATPAQMVFSTAPYWGVLAAWVALGEPVSLNQIIAAILMIAALLVLYRERHGHTHRHDPKTHMHWHHHRDGHHEHRHPQHTKRGLFGWHIHTHQHDAVEHDHNHRSDIHHRHH